MERQMVRISVQVRSGAVGFRVGIQAPSIREALALVESSYPNGEVKVVFPIEPKGFFAGKVPAGVTGHERIESVAA